MILKTFVYWSSNFELGFLYAICREKMFSFKLTVTSMELFLKEIYAWNSNIVKILLLWFM